MREIVLVADKARILADTNKLVFSMTLQKADWGNVRTIRTDLPARWPTSKPSAAPLLTYEKA